MALQDIKREEEHEEGAPAWMVTYGDMMGLLLCFFIMLVAMSEVRQDKFERMVDSIRKAFGYTQGIEVSPGPTERATSIFEDPLLMQSEHGENAAGGAEIVNIRGREFTCRTVREGTLVTVGDRNGFEAASAVLSDDMKLDLDAIAADAGDQANRLLIRGHTSTRDAIDGADDWTLAWKRALAVKDYLVEKGINPDRLRLSSCGRSDPMESNLTAAGRRANRRVEIISSGEVVSDAFSGRAADE